MKILKTIKPNKIHLCEGETRNLYIHKITNSTEWSILPALVKDYGLNDLFKTIVIPEATTVGLYSEKESGNINFHINVEYLKGSHYDWTEKIESPGYGGALISNEEVETVHKMLDDLEKAKIQIVTGEQADNDQLIKRAIHIVEASGLPEFIQTQAIARLKMLPKNILRGPDQFLYNGDFQFRNFIKMENGKVGLIDWESCFMSAFGREFGLAYISVLMFNNQEFIDKLLAAREYDKERFDYIYFRTLVSQHGFWQKIPHLSKVLFSKIKKELDNVKTGITEI